MNSQHYQIQSVTSEVTFQRCTGNRGIECKHEPRCRHFSKLGFGRVVRTDSESLESFPGTLAGLENALTRAAVLSKDRPVELVLVKTIAIFDGGEKI